MPRLYEIPSVAKMLRLYVVPSVAKMPRLYVSASVAKCFGYMKLKRLAKDHGVMLDSSGHNRIKIAVSVLLLCREL